MKKTLIIGASINVERYAYKAANMLLKFGHEIVLIGKVTGEIANHKIQKEKMAFKDIDTITLYINPNHQVAFYDYIIDLKPKRVIFNPGTENTEFEQQLNSNGIQTLQACTLVLLSTGQY